MGICIRNLENQRWMLVPTTYYWQLLWRPETVEGVAIMKKPQVLNCPPYFCHLYLQDFQDFTLWEFFLFFFFGFLFWLTEWELPKNSSNFASEVFIFSSSFPVLILQL